MSVLVTGPHGLGFASAVRAASSAGSVEGELPDVSEVDLRGTDGEGVEAVVVAAEHGTWTCCGVLQRDRFKAVHAADTMLADLVARKLAERLEGAREEAAGARG